MQKNIIIILTIILAQFCNIPLHAAIGDWKAYMAYHDVQEIEEAGNLIFVQASNGLYVYNKNDQSIQTFSKVDYLNDCEIAHIAYNKSAKRLVILYSTGNIDLMNINNYEVTNLPDYYNASITEDKTVSDIYIYGNFAYLSTGFGIVKLNASQAEISDTYNLGFKVNWCEIDGNTIYAYSQTNGKYSASLSDNLLDKSCWSRVGGYIAKTQEDKSELKQLVSTLNPGGPKYNYFWFMKFFNGLLYTCGGGYRPGGDTNRPGTIQVYDSNNWTIFDDDIAAKTGIPYVEQNAVAVDPLDPNHIFAGGRTGLYEFRNGKFVNLYNSTNSIITPFKDLDSYQIIGSISYDKEGNLWLSNELSSHNQSLIEYTKNGEWVSHHNNILYDKSLDASLAAMECLTFDSRNLLWFVNNHWSIPSFYCYQPSTNVIKGYTSFTNEDGTTVNPGAVRTLAEDKKGNIWIGTKVGPLLLEANQITEEQPIFIQIKVPRNDGTNYADYLLDGVDISCIAIDKANRKWFGTIGNGIYLISNDNLEQLQHFTADNSKLLSDNIESIAIEETTGKIFIGTDKGLCSYQSDTGSINESMNKNNVWAYPNPVHPNYTGNITITGLSYNADIKITSVNGSLIKQGKSNGGSYLWDGCDFDGKKVASGIYMVETATSNGDKGTVCKIAILR